MGKYTAQRFFTDYLTKEIVPAWSGKIEFETKDEMNKFIHRQIERFIDNSQRMGETEDGKCAKMDAIIRIKKDLKIIDLSFGDESIINERWELSSPLEI